MAKQVIGKVVSIKMNKTAVVEVQNERPHPIYKKTIRKMKRFKVHNENAEVKEGDVVTIVPTRPISKDKSWKVAEVK